MAKALSAKPAGLLYAADLLSADEEAALLPRLAVLRFDPIVMHGQAARRTARHFGLDYDYELRKPSPGEPMPAWLAPVRERAAQLAQVEPVELIEILVQKYPPGSTISWHRDAPAFGTVVGVSLASACRLRFQRGKGDDRRTWEIVLEPRSGYVLAGEARTAWQHAIPPVKTLRYSITFRTAKAR
jgi:alkylated DNA repair protein (DNA oxidative demethylase)